MSVGSVAVQSRAIEGSLVPGLAKRLVGWSISVGPSQGWATFVLLIAMLMVVGESVTSAEWVPTPGMLLVLLSAAAVGLLLAKTGAHALVLHTIGLGLGLAVVVWQTSSLIQSQPLGQRVPELWSRVREWYSAISSGGVSADLIPFTLALLAIGWTLAYLSSWFIFRRNNVWAAVVLCALAIVTNLGVLPDPSAFRIALFIFFTMLLVVRMRMIEDHGVWRKAKIEFNLTDGWRTMHAAAWFIALVMLLAAFLPLKSVEFGRLRGPLETAIKPLEGFEVGFSRVFSAIPSRKKGFARFDGKTMPFLGKISLANDIVFWARTEYPTYWTTRTYSEYSPWGWVSGETKRVAVSPDAHPVQQGDSLRRVPIKQNIELSFTTSRFLSSGGIQGLSRDAVFRTLKPQEFVLNIRDPSEDWQLPDDVRLLAEELRRNINPPSEEFLELNNWDGIDSHRMIVLEAYISKSLPHDLALIDIAPSTDGNRQSLLEAVTLLREDPGFTDIVSWRFAYRVPVNNPYDMVTEVSVATDDELRDAGTHYHGFIKDHYLQLPANLPQRVRDLAKQVVGAAGVETPLDKTMAIQSYLREADFEYSLNIDAPPFDADGVDHFLFETKKGYSAYFASAMAVMLRAVGVPARVAVGYGHGEYDEVLGRWVVRGTDQHGWTQVYFPEYGWIAFEPTPVLAAYTGRLLTGPGTQFVPDRLSPPILEGDEPFIVDPWDPFDEYGLFDNIPPEQQSPLSRSTKTGLVISISIMVVFLASAWLFLRTAWTRGLSDATIAERAYTKMGRLGVLAGLGPQLHQTPAEYARDMGRAIPAIAPDTLRIATAFASDRYGRRVTEQGEQDDVNRAWIDIRLKLVIRAFARLFPKRLKASL